MPYLSVKSKLLGLFFNPLTADHMYAAHNWEKIPQQVQTQLPSKPKTVSQIFISFWKYTWNFAHLEKKGSAYSLKYLGIYWPPKLCLLECKKVRVSEHPPGVNSSPGLKHCSNLRGITFILIFHYSKTNWVRNISLN